MTGRRRGRDSERADGDTHAHNTLSPDDPDVQVFYPLSPTSRCNSYGSFADRSEEMGQSVS